MDQSVVEFAQATDMLVKVSVVLCLSAAIQLTDFDDKSKAAQQLATLTYHIANITFHVMLLFALTLIALVVSQ